MSLFHKAGGAKLKTLYKTVLFFLENNEIFLELLFLRTFPANIYLFKARIETVEKGVKYTQS